MEDYLSQIKQAIADQGLSQTKAAQKCGIATGTLCRILNGQQELKPNTREKIFSALSIDNDQDVDLDRINYKGIVGFIEYNGKIHKVDSLKSLVGIVNDIKNDYTQTINDAKEFRQIEKQNAKKVKGCSLSPSDIDLFNEESIDASLVKTWSFRKSEDERDDVQNSLGNMCKGYPFTLNGEVFQNSEAAYICGMFSNNTQTHQEIQHLLQLNDNGYAAKKEIRRRFESHKRSDWAEFNVQWMLYVVWNKCCTNADFANMLKSVPRDHYIIENSTLQKGETATFWGMKNHELEDCRSVIEHECELKGYDDSTKDVNNQKMIERNKINNIGTWMGVDCMGKILKICQLCLLDGTQPPIDYDLLRSKEIHLMGQILTF